VNKQEQIVLSEINTIPGFTKTSLFPRLWEASGLSYSAMLTQILELALRRKERE
jgi:D-alanine-D-alanine ligase